MLGSRAWPWLVLVSACGAPESLRPEPDEPKPLPADVRASDQVVEELPPADPVLWRLPDAQYRAAMADLLGSPVPDSVTVPRDSELGGLSTRPEALPVSEALLEAHVAVAEAHLGAALNHPKVEPDVGEVEPLEGNLEGSADHPWVSRALWRGTLTVARAGAYRITMTLHQTVLSPRRDDGSARLYLDGGTVGTATVPAQVADAEVVFLVSLQPGAHPLIIDVGPIQQPYWMGTDTVIWEGPTDVLPNPLYDRLVPCDLNANPEACSEQVVVPFAERAFVRPLSEAERLRLLGLGNELREAGDSPDQALGAMLEVVLLDPRFWFRVEPDGPAGYPRPLTPHELARRLAATVWAGPPDAELRSVADDGTLTQDAVLALQVRRMLADPRSVALADGFLWDWLNLDNLSHVAISPGQVPGFDSLLADDMEEELRALLRVVSQPGVPLARLLDHPTGHLSDPLATWYGLGQGGAAVPLEGVGRGGLLGTAGLHAILGHGARSSPTRRGQYMLDRLLCRPPESPPPNVPSLAEGDSARDLVEAHAADPVCASCHKEMDPLGFALEHFDGAGRWRDADGGGPIDAVGTLPDGTEVAGLRGVVSWIQSQDAFEACVVDNLFAWSMGRPPSPVHDDPQAIVEAARANGGSLQAAVEALVLSPSFRVHRSAP